MFGSAFSVCLVVCLGSVWGLPKEPPQESSDELPNTFPNSLTAKLFFLFSRFSRVNSLPAFISLDYSSYGSFPKQGDPNIGPQNTIVLIMGTPKKGTPKFGKPSSL